MKKSIVATAAVLLLFSFRSTEPVEQTIQKSFQSKKTLLILQENTGKLDVLPENTPAEFKKFFAVAVDRIAETFEDIKSDLQGAGRYDKIIHLTDVNCTKAKLLATLISETVSGNEIDIFAFGHGSPESLVLNNETLTGGTTGTIRKLLTDARAQRGPKFSFNLRLVYMCHCYGGTTNDDWLAIGAKTSVGSKCLNFMAEPMITLFTHKFVLENKSIDVAAHESWTEATAAWTAANSLFPVLGYNTPPAAGFGCIAGQNKYQTSKPTVEGDGSIKFNPLKTSFVIPTTFRQVGDIAGTTSDDNLAEGTYHIINAASTTNKQLNVHNGCLDESICKVQLYQPSTASNNKWVVSKIDGILGGYTIKSVANNKFLDADLSLPGGNLLVANVFENACKVNTASRISSALPRTNQEWKIVNRGNGLYTIKCIMSGLYLDAANACVNENLCGVQLWENYSQASQKWKFVKVN